MNDKDWKILLTLYEEGTITKTAHKLYISQPALTYRINQLEKEFNTKVIYRGNKGVIFTKEGYHLVSYAKKMLKELRKTKDNIINMKENVQGTLRIGVSSNFALYQLPVLLERFLSKYPKAEISLITGWSSKILSQLQSEEVHVAIIRGEHEWSGEQLSLNQETLCVTSKEKIDINNLPNLNFIRYQTDIHLKNTFDEWWQSNFNVPPKISMEVDRIETCKELVKKGLGYAFFPSICLKESDNLYTVDLTKNGVKLLRKTSMVYKNQLMDLNIINVFVNFIKEFYQLNN